MKETAAIRSARLTIPPSASPSLGKVRARASGLPGPETNAYLLFFAAAAEFALAFAAAFF